MSRWDTDQPAHDWLALTGRQDVVWLELPAGGNAAQTITDIDALTHWHTIVRYETESGTITGGWLTRANVGIVRVEGGKRVLIVCSDPADTTAIMNIVIGARDPR